MSVKMSVGLSYVTLRCIKSHLSHVVSLSTCNVFTFVFIVVLLHCLS